MEMITRDNDHRFVPFAFWEREREKFLFFFITACSDQLVRTSINSRVLMVTTRYSPQWPQVWNVWTPYIENKTYDLMDTLLSHNYLAKLLWDWKGKIVYINAINASSFMFNGVQLYFDWSFADFATHVKSH